MYELVLSNIVRSLGLFAEKVELPGNLVEVRDERPAAESATSGTRAFLADLSQSLAYKLALNGKRPVPWFYRDESAVLRSPQESFFGFYALRNAIRGSLIGARMIQAGAHLEKGQFLAPSVSMYYAGAFHALTAFLSLRGRALVETVLGPPVVVLRKESTHTTCRQMDRHPEAVMAILTRNNRWVFEPRARSHRRRWDELRQVFASPAQAIPEFVVDFCRYLTCYDPEHASACELLDRGLQRLVEMRHESIYVGYGFDDVVYYDLINRDRFSDTGIDLRARSFREFATRMLIDSIETLHRLKQQIDEAVWQDVHLSLACAIMAPPFEASKPTLEGFPDQTGKLREIDAWVWPTGD